MADQEIGDLSSWRIQQLRLTLFAADSSQEFGAAEWWTDIVGHKPEIVTTKPGTGELFVSGALSDPKLALVLHVQPARADWYFQPIIGPEVELVSDFPTFAPLPTGLAFFESVMGPWVVRVPPVQRIAVGAVLFQAVVNKIDGYRRLAEYLKESVQLDIVGSTDFSYSINRPRQSKTIDIAVNRVSNWSVALLQKMSVAVPSAAGQVTRTILPKGEVAACRLEVDVNTDAAFTGNLLNEQLPALFSELAALVREIAAKGDTK